LELDTLPACEPVDLVRITYPIRDMERVIATAKTDKRCVEYPLDLGLAEGEPPPRSTHILLDAPLPSLADLTVDNTPTVAGYVFVFGKETDREARVVYQVQRTSQFDSRKALIGQVFGDALAPDGSEEVLGQRQHIPFWDLDEPWFPTETPLDRVREVRMQLRHRHVFDIWPKRPWQYLGGKSPQEAARDPAARVKLLGFLLYAELMSQRDAVPDFDFDVVRRHLGLPEASPLPADAQPGEVPLARLARLPMAELSDDNLQAALSRAVHYRASAAAQRAALEVVARPSLDEKVSKAGVYTTLALLTEDTRRALEYVDLGRTLAEEEGESSAQFDLHEVSLRLRRGEPEEATRLINHLLQEHIDEPGVAQSLRNLFLRMGIVGPDGRARVQPGDLPDADEGQSEPPAPATKLWTPGGEQPAAASKPSLIIPG
jgi:hypothetical protein